MNKLRTLEKNLRKRPTDAEQLLLEILKNETDGRVEIQETAASGQLYN